VRVGLERGGLAIVLAIAALALPAAAGADPVPLATFGAGNGGAAGQLSSPTDVDLDPGGNLYVSETGNDRVSVFAPDGSFIWAFGYDVIPGGASGFEACTTATTCKAGVAGGSAGQLSNPEGLTVDPTGHFLYVVENPGLRISEFDISSTPTFVRAFGRDVDPAGGTGFEICASACKAGVAGTDAGELGGLPLGIDSDAAGNLLVADQLNSRINVYQPNGSFLHSFGTDVNPAGGTGFEVCTTASGCKIGLNNTGEAGQMAFPHGAAVGPDGRLYVSEGGRRVDVFQSPAATPALVRAYGYDVIPGGAAGFEVCTNATTCQFGASGNGAGEFSNPVMNAVDSAGNVIVPDQNQIRVNVFDSRPDFVHAFGFDVIAGGGAGYEVCTADTTCQAGLPGTGNGQFSGPRGTATDCRDAIYVADVSAARVAKFGEPGTANPPCVSGGGGGGGGGGGAGGTTKPSNQFTLGRPKLDKRRGTAKLSVTVQAPGHLELAGKSLRPASADAGSAGEVTLTIKATGSKKQKLADAGKVKVNASVTFTPTGGDPNTQSERVRLVKRS
jgi:hypothetical protein